MRKQHPIEHESDRKFTARFALHACERIEFLSFVIASEAQYLLSDLILSLREWLISKVLIPNSSLFSGRGTR